MVTWSCEFDLTPYLSISNTSDHIPPVTPMSSVLFSLSGSQTQIQAIRYFAPEEGTGGEEVAGGEVTGGEGAAGAGAGGVGALGLGGTACVGGTGGVGET